jgi:hypothetical protein
MRNYRTLAQSDSTAEQRQCPICKKPRNAANTAHGRCAEELAKRESKRSRRKEHNFTSRRYAAGDDLPGWMYS